MQSRVQASHRRLDEEEMGEGRGRQIESVFTSQVSGQCVTWIMRVGSYSWACDATLELALEFCVATLELALASPPPLCSIRVEKNSREGKRTGRCSGEMCKCLGGRGG